LKLQILYSHNTTQHSITNTIVQIKIIRRIKTNEIFTTKIQCNDTQDNNTQQKFQYNDDIKNT